MMKGILYIGKRGEWKKSTRMGQSVSSLVEERKMNKGCLSLNTADSIWTFKAKLLSESYSYPKVSVVPWCLVPRLVMMLSFGLLLHSTQLLQAGLSVGSDSASTQVLLPLSKGKDGRGNRLP